MESNGFKKMTPDDYYSMPIVKEFNHYNMSITNYNTSIYKRNPDKKGKLTLNHIEFIEFYVRLLKPSNFLELGTQFGECSLKLIELIPNEYIGVDIQKQNNIDYLLKKYKNFKFFNGSTDEYFLNLKKNQMDFKFDMVFIDACHSHEATYKDFLNVKEHINEDGIIFFHDCYPYSKEWTNPSLCGDGYKTSEVIRKKHFEEFEIITIPVNPGISMARKCSKQLAWL
jgi:predicted O-methyltransferase YrrM